MLRSQIVKRRSNIVWKHAGAGDIVILAGKGHEDYQEIKGVKHHMDERDLIQIIEGR